MPGVCSTLLLQAKAKEDAASSPYRRAPLAPQAPLLSVGSASGVVLHCRFYVNETLHLYILPLLNRPVATRAPQVVAYVVQFERQRFLLARWLRLLNYST